MCEPMGRREIFLTFSLLVEIEGHFTNEFVSYVYETEVWYCKRELFNPITYWGGKMDHV
jgi:hypothetical protein